jgi:hypothetical protein
LCSSEFYSLKAIDRVSIEAGKKMMKQWYEELFENYADKYEQEGYTSGTLGEVDFNELMGLPRSTSLRSQ